MTKQPTDVGGVITSLNGSMQNVTVARMGPDGTLETFCTSDPEAAAEWMRGGPPGSAAKPDEGDDQ